MPWTAGSKSNWCGGKVRRRGDGELAGEESKPAALKAKAAAPGCVHADKPKARISARIRRRREWMRRTEVVRSFGRPYVGPLRGSGQAEGPTPLKKSVGAPRPRSG